MKLLPKTRAAIRVEHDDGSVSEVTDMLAAVGTFSGVRLADEADLSKAMSALQRRLARKRSEAGWASVDVAALFVALAIASLVVAALYGVVTRGLLP